MPHYRARVDGRAAATSFTTSKARVLTLASAEHPEMPASVITGGLGWTGSDRWFRQNVVGLRPDYRSGRSTGVAPGHARAVHLEHVSLCSPANRY